MKTAPVRHLACAGLRAFSVLGLTVGSVFFSAPMAVAQNSCNWAFDGDCDDGRPGALTSLCALGTDTADCGPVPGGGGGGGGASGPNSCSFAFDGDCDDGRAGALTSLCSFGTDQADCSAIGSGGGGGTSTGANSCQFAFDGDCDEPNGLNLCPRGTDTADCSNPNSNFGTGSGFAGGGRPAPPPPPAAPQIPSTLEGRQIQTALNYFGFNAGFVDGQIGGGTRAAIERYQVAMGYPVNGRNLAADQLGTLLGAFSWATTQGGAQQAGVTGTALLIVYTNRLAGGTGAAPTGATPTAPTVPQQPARPPRGGAGTGGGLQAGICPTPQTSDGVIASYGEYQTAYFLDAAGDTVAFTTGNDGSFAYGTVYAPLALMTLTWDSDVAGQPIAGTTQSVSYAGTTPDLPRPTDGLTWSGSETASFEDGSVEQFTTSVSVGVAARETIAGCSLAVRPIVVTRTPADGNPAYVEYFFELMDFSVVYFVGFADVGAAPQIETPTGLSVRPDDGIDPAAALPGAFLGIGQTGVSSPVPVAPPAAPAPVAPVTPAVPAPKE